MPGAMPGLPDPFSEDCADTDEDTTDLNLWSWLPTPALRPFQVSQSCFNDPASMLANRVLVSSGVTG